MAGDRTRVRAKPIASEGTRGFHPLGPHTFAPLDYAATSFGGLSRVLTRAGYPLTHIKVSTCRCMSKSP